MSDLPVIVGDLRVSETGAPAGRKISIAVKRRDTVEGRSWWDDVTTLSPEGARSLAEKLTVTADEIQKLNAEDRGRAIVELKKKREDLDREISRLTAMEISRASSR